MKKIPIYECLKSRSPVAPYFSNVYMTIISIIQSAALAYLLVQLVSENTKTNDFTIQSVFSLDFFHNNLKLILRFIVSGAAFSLIWYKYVNHHQYIGWQLSYFDAILMFILAFLEFMILTSMRYGNIGTFYLFIDAVYLYGVFAYNHAQKNFNEPYSKVFLSNHYRCSSDFISRKNKNQDILFDFMNHYFKKSKQYSLSCFMFLGG